MMFDMGDRPLTKLGALKVLDHDLWVANMRLAFEDGRTPAEAIVWLAKMGYDGVTPRAMREAIADWRKEQGHSIRTERPEEPPAPTPWKVPCKACKGFGHLNKDGEPSLKSRDAMCKACNGIGRVQGQGPRQPNGGRLVAQKREV